MRAYCIFDDFLPDCLQKLKNAGITVTVCEKGQARPDDIEMKAILEKYDIVIIGTSQKIYAWMWENITTPRIIGTASVGVDHIKVPENKRHLLTIINTPHANARSVAEYVIGTALMFQKRILEGNKLYYQGKSNKSLVKKPQDLHGATVGLIGAGHISTMIMELMHAFGVHFLSYTKHPNRHSDLTEKYGVKFVSLLELAERSDIISVNVTSDQTTVNLVNSELITAMKNDCIFISISRAQVVDIIALLEKAKLYPNFYIGLDLDVSAEHIGKNNGNNIIFTPHIAGGTIETRKRMFEEVTEGILKTCCMI